MSAHRIVVIDDSPMILRTAKLALEKAGFAVTTLDNPSAFEVVRDAEPDLILLDINMPELFGDDVVEFFRQEWKINAPIFLCSDIPEDELRQRAMSSGASGYICKGWGLEVLVQRVQQALQARV
jgi:DNA-binding response OmpR family regulator